MVTKGWHSVQLAYRRGCNVNFAHAVWDGGRVAIFVDGGTCQEITGAYDIDSGNAVPFLDMKVRLGDAIVRDYSVTAAELKETRGDIFSWASYLGDGQMRRGIERFREQYHP